MSHINTYPPLLVEFFDQIKLELQKNNIKDNLAADTAKNVVDTVRRNLGGSMMYIPKASGVDEHEKHCEIRKAFTGKNHKELSKRYNLSIQIIYKIVKTANPEKTTTESN